MGGRGAADAGVQPAEPQGQGQGAKGGRDEAGNPPPGHPYHPSQAPRESHHL